MSLPDVPNTLREKYYSVMAGQNDADILPDIETAPSTENRYLDYIARNGGGGGNVTKEYVDTAIATAVAVKVDKVEGKGLSTNDYTNADKALVQGSPITTTSTTSPLTDSADGMVQGLTIYGKSEVVDGEIKSVGDNGLTVTTANSDNTVTTSAEFTTALPLRGVSDTVRDKLTCMAESKQVETVCGKVRLADLSWEIVNNLLIAILPIDSQKQMPGGINALCSKYARAQTDSYPLNKEFTANNYWISTTRKLILIHDDDYTTVSDFVTSLGDAELVYELAEPVITPLTDAEISAFRSLRTYDSTTNIAITDEPDFELDYLKNTNNGKAVADIQTDLQEQIDDKITVSPLLTLTIAGWDSTTLQQTVTFVHDTTKRNVIDVDPASVEEWAACGIIARNETASDITFTCKSIPENALLFKVTSMGV